MKKHWNRFADGLGEAGFEALGWGGFALVLGAYAALTWELLPATSLGYQGANLAGAACLGLSAVHRGARPIAWLNGVWAVIAVAGIARSMFFA